MPHWVLWISLALLNLVRLSSTELSTDDPSYKMEHDLGLGTFTSRGSLRLPGAKRKDAEPHVSQNALEADEIMAMGSKDGHGLYRLKLNSQSGDDNNTTVVMGYTCLDSIKSTSLHDVITVYSDDEGSVVGVSVRPISSVLVAEDETEFETTLLVRSPSLAPVPDTAAFLEKLREEKIQKEQADKDPKSFLGKYWMYIVPVVVFMFMSNAAQSQQGG